MCNWLEDAINFLFPEPVEQDMDGDKQVDIPESVSDSDAYSEPVDIPVDIPEHLRRLPVLEPDDTPLIADAYVRAGGGG
jgi:hypothetical protein